MAGVIGIGGIFIKFKNPVRMREWYRDVLNMTINDFGVLFEFNTPKANKGYLQLGTFEASTDYFGNKNQQAMINFRVDDLTLLLEKLIVNKVNIVDCIETYSYGKFLHIEDPEGNRIELWEPIDSDFEKSDDSKMPMK